MWVAFAKCKSYSHFFRKNIRVYAIFNDQSFNDTLTKDIVSFEQLGPVHHYHYFQWSMTFIERRVNVDAKSCARRIIIIITIIIIIILYLFY